MDHDSKTARKDGGFTLIELLVVISIIALLMSLLLPSLTKARQQATAVVCMSNMKDIYRSLTMYKFNYNGFYPLNLWSENAWYVPKPDLWFYKLYDEKYLGNGKVLICPGDPLKGEYDIDDRNNQLKAACGYGMNYLLRHLGEPNSFDVEHFPYGPTDPKRVLLLTEVGPDGSIPTVNNGYMGPAKPWRDGGRLIWDDGYRWWYSQQTPSWLTARHVGSIRVLTFDGRVVRVPTKQLMKQRIRSYYADCAAGDCSFCKYWRVPHYNFAKAGVWWWTGNKHP